MCVKIKLSIMKNLFLLVLVLTSVSLRAEWLKGTIMFNDSTVKAGYIKFFDKADASKVYFKHTPDGKSESIPSEQLKLIEMYNDKGVKIKLMYLHPAQLPPFSKKMKIDKGYLWFGTIYEGDFNVLMVNLTTANGAYMSNGSTSTDQYYINWPGEDHAMLSAIVAGGLTFVVGNKKMMKLTNELIFKGRCDKMLEDFENEKFKPSKIGEVIDYYEKNCGN